MARLILMLMPLVTMPAPSQGSNPADVNVATVYNIIRFTRFSQRPQRLVLCVWAPATTARAFMQLDGKPVNDGKLQVRVVSRPDQLRKGCNIAFLQNDVPPDLISNVPMTISDVGTIRDSTVLLRRVGRQISFEIDVETGAQQGVRFSARLLSLATTVRGE